MIIDDRPKLRAALEDDETTILLLAPTSGDIMKEIHDEAVAAVKPQPWRKTFLLKEITILLPDERDQWLPDGTDYCILGGDSPKTKGPQGGRSDLMLADGTPSRMKIRAKFAEGDQL
jgi:hypothetical protein